MTVTTRDIAIRRLDELHAASLACRRWWESTDEKRRQELAQALSEAQTAFDEAVRADWVPT